MTNEKEINFAQVEDTRPPIYTAMKYWGKKPHNIWRHYIEHYTPEDGLFLDPCMGSSVSIFEAMKAKRKAIGFDINPLSSFIVTVLSSEFDAVTFKDKVDNILSTIYLDDIYKEFFSTKCQHCDNNATAQSFKWDKGKVYEIGVECYYCYKDKGRNIVERLNGKWKRHLKEPDDEDNKIIEKISTIDIPFWFPDDKFPNSPSFSGNFVECIGGNQFKDLWTRRNLYILSKIFANIILETDKNIKQQLIFGFIQTIHLCTKMSVPRREQANRAFSTSWGRSAYLCSSRQMEMNPALAFESSCIGKQSVESALSKNYDYIGRKPKKIYVSEANKSNRSKNFDVKYGVVDIQNISDYIDDESINFAMVDFPYGGLVQYLDLSSIWLVWLKKLDAKLYSPNYDAEITIKAGIQEKDIYEKKILSALKKLFKVLKNDGKIVFTFHNKKLEIWNSFLRSINLSGFEIEHVIHQQNRRTGESNVANPYGTSASDFYIRCIKSNAGELKTDLDEFQHFVIKKSVEIIALRNEPTPYQLLFNGLLAEISKAGFDLSNFDSNINKLLSDKIGSVFKIIENKDNNSGAYWWFVKPQNHIKHGHEKLSERVEKTILNLLKRKIAIKFDDALAEIYINYPNGLTPDIKSVDSILKKYASRSGGSWVLKSSEIEIDFTNHTKVIYDLSQIGKKLGYKIYIGKREQGDKINGHKLSEYSDFRNLNFLNNYNTEQIKRIEMIDIIWLKESRIFYAIEVENSTNFSSGIQRCSNLSFEINKIMVLPDNRENEFLNIQDPLFTESFRKHNWVYMLYMDIEKLNKKRNILEKKLTYYCRKLPL